MIWLDHAATSLPRWGDAVEIAAALVRGATPGRGRHGPQLEAARALEQARRTVAEVVGGRIVCFGAGATFALNTAIAGWRPRPRRIAIDPWAHNAVRRPALRCGVPVWTLPVDRALRLDVVAAAREWPADLDLVVVTHASNVDGTVLPVAALVELAHRRGAAVVVDAAQTVGTVIPLDVGDADAIAFSGHKGLRALPGTGVLALGSHVEIEPLVTGGTGEDALDDDMPACLPMRLEAGTPDLGGIGALAVGAARARPWPWRERAAMLREVVEAAGFDVIGGRDLPIVGVVVPAPGELEDALDRGYGITSRAGLHCAPSAHRTVGTFPTGTLRISAGSTTTEADLAALGAALGELRRHFAGSRTSGGTR
jgi:selenocysteine lyase/cysteine desulfurase